MEARRLTTIWGKIMQQSTKTPLTRAFKIGIPTTGMEVKGDPVNFITVIAANATPENLNAIMNSGLFNPKDTVKIVTKGLATALCLPKIANATIFLGLGANIDVMFGEKKRTLLSMAITNENVEAVKFLIDNNADLNLYDPQGDSPFLLAVKADNGPIVELLMKSKRVNLRAPNKSNQTIAHCAVRLDKLKALAALVDNRDNLEFYSAEGFSLLQYAAVSGSFAGMRLLLNSGFRFMTKTGLVSYFLHLSIVYAKLQDRLEKLRFLLDNGAYAYEKMLPDVLIYLIKTYPAYANRFAESDPAIVIAIIKGYFEEFKLFLDAGMNPNSRIFGGTCSLLHLVCEVGNVQMAIHLVSLGADTRANDSTGKTPFDYSSPEFTNQVIYNN